MQCIYNNNNNNDNIHYIYIYTHIYIHTYVHIYQSYIHLIQNKFKIVHTLYKNTAQNRCTAANNINEPHETAMNGLDVVNSYTRINRYKYCCTKMTLFKIKYTSNSQKKGVYVAFVWIDIVLSKRQVYKYRRTLPCLNRGCNALLEQR